MCGGSLDDTLRQLFIKNSNNQNIIRFSTIIITYGEINSFKYASNGKQKFSTTRISIVYNIIYRFSGVLKWCPSKHFLIIDLFFGIEIFLRIFNEQIVVRKTLLLGKTFHDSRSQLQKNNLTIERNIPFLSFNQTHYKRKRSVDTISCENETLQQEHSIRMHGKSKQNNIQIATRKYVQSYRNHQKM